MKTLLPLPLSFCITCITCIILAGCPQIPPPPPPGPGGEGCGAACSNMRRLGCELGEPTPNGAPCEAVCQGAERNGVHFATSCVALAGTCAEADGC